MKVINQNTARTSTAEPAASAMTYGEIAINYHADNPRILIKDSTNKIIAYVMQDNTGKTQEVKPEVLKHVMVNKTAIITNLKISSGRIVNKK